MSSKLVRRAGPADAEAIAAIHVGGWRWAYRGVMSDALLDGLSVTDRAAGWAHALSTLDAPLPPPSTPA